MKTSTFLLLVLSIFAFGPIQATDFFAFKAENCDYKTKHGMLHGDFSQNYPNGEKMVEGKFDHNQRVGTWNFYNLNGQLLEKRLYFNNLSYAIMHKGKKTWKEFDADGKWDLIRGRDVKFKQRLWKQVNKENEGYLNIDKLVKTINSSTTGDFYAEERFIDKIDKTQLSNITSIQIKEDYIYDNERESMFVRTLGIGFVNSNNETVAWIYYPDWMASFKKVKTTWHNNDLDLRTLYDVFTLRAYNAKPYRQGKEKLKDKSMAELELEMVHQENMFIIAKA